MREETQSFRHSDQAPAPHVTADRLEAPRQPRMIPVWFFVGAILLVYGVVILITGLLEFSSPPPTELSNLHPAVGWGVLLLVIGALYVYLFLPRQSSRR